MPASPTASRPPITYRLYIRVPRRSTIVPGRLGRHVIERGWYVYTGSARRHMAARLRRHLSVDGRRHWHIDWLIGAGPGEVAHIRLDAEPECQVNATMEGEVVIPGFGATDCRSACGSHLLRLGSRRPVEVPARPAERGTWAVVAECMSQTAAEAGT